MDSSAPRQFDEREINRRDFNRLTAAALGGMLAGSVAGCGSNATVNSDAAANQEAGKHVCRGLNECKGQGPDKKNDCRGMGTCATYTHHDCAEMNECKFQGGCGSDAGRNECKGKGGCQVPLMDAPWEQLRGELVAKWKKEGQTFHDAPPKPK